MISDKIDFKSKTGNKRQRWALNKNKKDNSSRIYNSY